MAEAPLESEDPPGEDVSEEPPFAAEAFVCEALEKHQTFRSPAEEVVCQDCRQSFPYYPAEGDPAWMNRAIKGQARAACIWPRPHTRYVWRGVLQERGRC